MRILSWNIQWGRGADGRVELSRTIAAIRALGTLDVVCLQEVARHWPGLPGQPAPQDGPGRLAEAFPAMMPVYAPGLEFGEPGGGSRAFGNMILSALPVGQILRHPLPFPCDRDAVGMQRVCAEVVVRAGRSDLRIMTTHLEYYSGRQRQAQIEALMDLQREVVAGADQARDPGPDSTFGMPPRPSAAVLCGDFNCPPEGPEYRRLCDPAAGHWDDAWRVARGSAPHDPTVGLHGAEWPDHPYCCDYFFVTPELAGRVRRIEVIADTPASDHQPVLLEIDPA